MTRTEVKGCCSVPRNSRQGRESIPGSRIRDAHHGGMPVKSAPRGTHASNGEVSEGAKLEQNMSVNTSAAQAAVTGHHREEASAAPRLQRGALAGRQVTEQPESQRSLSPHRGRRADSEPVAGAGRSLGARLVRIIRSALRRPQASVETPRDTPLRALLPERLVAARDVPESPAESRAGRTVARVRLLPWLTPEQNAERPQVDRMLGALRDRQDVPPDKKADLDDAMELVADLERHVVRADELLNRSRTEILTESDWRELATLVSSRRLQSSAAKSWLRALLGQFARQGALDSPAGRALQELHERVADANRHLLSNDMRWDDTVRCVETRLPVGRRLRVLPVVVHSRVVEGRALGVHLAQGYPAEHGVGRQDAARYLHVRELALTNLVGANGEMLFSGLRHALFNAGELNGHFLQTLDEDDLRTLIDTFDVGNRGVEGVGQTRAQLIRGHCDAVRRFDGVAEGSALLIARESRRRMALETAAAALVADSDKFQRALNGETVDLNLYCVSLLDGEDFDPWGSQIAEFNRLARSSPVALPVCSIDGAARPVRANVMVRQTAVWVDGEQRRVVGEPRLEVRRLLGSPATAAPGGAVRSRMEAMLSRARELSNDIAALGPRYVESCVELGTNHPSSAALLARGSDLQTEQERLERNARSLDEAARQLKRIWAERDDWPSGAAACEQVLPRLVLLGYWMGETPVLSCRAGSIATKQLDGEVKFLATATHSLNGHLARLKPNSGAWEQARRDFTPQ